MICKKDTKVYNVLDSFEGRCVKVDLEGYFGVDSHVRLPSIINKCFFFKYIPFR